MPQFEIRIEGAGLPRDILRDVTRLTYKDSIKEIDSFELVVNNWDPELRDFKYVGAETAKDLKDQSANGRRFKLFEPCGKSVQVSMGYAGKLRPMMVGNFTTMEPTFSGSSAPTLNVRGLNVLHQLRRKQYTTGWTDKRDSEVAENIATLIDNGPPKRKRFPMPIVTDDGAKGKEPAEALISQKNQYDIDFLFLRARQRGYVVFIQEEDKERKLPRRLYFGPSQKGESGGLRAVTYELEWGKSLIEFKPTLTTANQVKSVTVNGWDRRSRKPISEKVDLDDKRLNVNRDLHEVLNTCDPREEVVVDEPVFTSAQARERAIAILMDRQKEMVKAAVTTVGLPDLRAGQKVKIAGLGARFSGVYFVSDSTHTIDDSGYRTTFNARREDPGTGGAA